jgi:HemY protein
MKVLFWSVIALGLSLGLALLLREDPGYVLVTMGSWAIETSMAVAVFCLLVAFGLFYLLLRLLHHLQHAPGRIVAATRRFKLHQSQQFLTRGMEELAEGRWKAAEHSLLKGSRASKTPALFYVGAAQAARHLGAPKRSEQYLQKLEGRPAGDALLAKLTRAEFLLADGQAVDARDILVAVLGEHPRHPRALELLARSYQQLGDWKKLQELLPALNKSSTFDKAGFTRLQRQVFSALLRETAHSNSLEELHALWQKIPESLRSEESLLIDYAGHLRDHNAAEEAEALLRQALNRQWSDQLAVGYGELGRGNITAQLANAEGWLKERPDNPHVLLTCGRLARRARQLEKARGYLERSIAILANPDTYQELAGVLEELGNKEDALQSYRTGLRLLSGRMETKEGTAVLPLADGSETTEPFLDQPAQGSALPRDPRQPAAS